MFSWNTASENIDITITTILNEGKQQDFECNSKKTCQIITKHKLKGKDVTHFYILLCQIILEFLNSRLGKYSVSCRYSCIPYIFIFLCVCTP